MSVQLMMGFDLIPGGFLPTNFTPTPLGNGIQPFVTAYNLVAAASGQTTDGVGVTGRTQDTMGDGRNALVIFRMNANVRPLLAFNAGNARPLDPNAPYRYTFGFRWRASSVGTSPAALNGDAFFWGMGTASILGTTAGNRLTFMGATVTAISSLARDQDYYFEVLIEHDGDTKGGSTYSAMMTLFVDGEQVMQLPAPALPTNVVDKFSPSIGIYRASTTSTSNVQRWLFNDIYLTDGEGDAPFNRNLGPQRVKLIFPDEVVSNTWGLSAGSDPLALIGQANGRDDTKFLTAPDDDTASSYRFGFPTNAKSVVNGIHIYARAKRDDGGSRPLVGSIATAGGTELNTLAPTVLTNTFADRLIGAYAPKTAAEAINLRDAALQNMVISLKAPTT